MKKLLFLFVILMLGFNLMNATEYDTLYVREGSKIIKKIVPVQEKIIEEIAFEEGVDPNIFSAKEIISLGRGREVKKEEIPKKVYKDFYFYKQDAYFKVNIYQLVNNKIRLIDTNLKKVLEYDNVGFGIFLAMVISVLFFGFFSLNKKNGRLHYLIPAFACMFMSFVICLMESYIYIDWFFSIIFSIIIVFLFIFLLASRTNFMLDNFYFILSFAFFIVTNFLVQLSFLLNVYGYSQLKIKPYFTWEFLYFQIILFTLGFALRESVLFYRKKINSV
jgi:hypothetical protein